MRRRRRARGLAAGGWWSPDAPGTWKFTLPANVKQVVQNMAEWDRISLYVGMPQTTVEPFMVITVGGERESRAEKDRAKYTVAGKREYVMNGNIATEWTGQTKAGAGFCELIVRRPGTAGETGGVCHALATATGRVGAEDCAGDIGEHCVGAEGSVRNDQWPMTNQIAMCE